MECCGHGNETSASVNCGELLDKLSTCQSSRNNCSTQLMILECLKLPVRFYTIDRCALKLGNLFHFQIQNNSTVTMNGP
jgi:hypothetical protein